MNVNKAISDGGGVWLPFAISRLRALRATGLPYASQMFTMSDGTLVRVEITGQHNYVRISGGETTVYMETGQLAWTFPAVENPTKADPAAWRFIDIPTTSMYLGRIKTSKKKLGEQANKPDLEEGMYSKAIGYPIKIAPAGATPEQVALIDAENAAKKIEYESRTIMKKLTAGFFPASVFSGKLRLFLQAQFGSLADIAGVYGFSTILTGSEPGLIYTGKGGPEIRFATYTSSSPGLFSAPDGTYWLIVITSPYSGQFVATGYKIKPSGACSGILSKLRSTSAPPTADERTKLEAYVFANSVVDTENPVVIGSFSGSPGEAMAYGWKWNSAGTEAKIVVQEVLGSGAADWRWKSVTMTVQFTYVPRTGDVPAHITLSASKEIHGEWTDGWGYFNIFVPYLDMLTAPLEHYSLATNVPGVMPKFSFPETPVYGYYINDVWTPITLSRHVPVPSDYPIIRSRVSGSVYFGAGVSENTEGMISYGVVSADASTGYEEHRLSEYTTMDVKVEGHTYNGELRVGSHRFFSRSVEIGGTTTSPGNNTANAVGLTSYYGAELPPIDTPIGDPTPYTTTATLGTVTTDNVEYTGIDDDRWTLVIPGWDSEAAYVITRGTSSEVNNIVHTVTTGTIVTHFSGHAFEYGNPNPVPYSFTPWTQADSKYSTGYGAPSPTDMVSTTDAVYSPPLYLRVNCYNQELRGVIGTPGSSYTQMLDVDRNYPFYDRGMYSYTSCGKRYVISEGLQSHPSIDYSHRFVGWA